MSQAFPFQRPDRAQVIQFVDENRPRIKRFTANTTGTTWLEVLAPQSSSLELLNIQPVNFDSITHNFQARVTDTSANVHELRGIAGGIPTGFGVNYPENMGTGSPDQKRVPRALGPGETLEVRIAEAIVTFEVSFRIDYLEYLGTA